MISGGFLDEEIGKRSMTFREFYHANQDSNSDFSFSDYGEEDDEDVGAPWHKGQSRKQKKKNKRGMYQNQVNKVLYTERDMQSSIMS